MTKTNGKASQEEEPLSSEPSIRLYQKLAQVMIDVERVVKRGYNSAQGYKFVSEADVLQEMRTSLIGHKLVIIPSGKVLPVERGQAKSGATNFLTTIEMTYKIIDTETGYAEIASMPGQGLDTGDKGVYKAITGANKYFLLKTFQIPTDDDPEKDEKKQESFSEAELNDYHAEYTGQKQEAKEQEPSSGDDPQWCKEHNVAMKKRQTENSMWFDHRRQNEAGVWEVCDGHGFHEQKHRSTGSMYS